MLLRLLLLFTLVPLVELYLLLEIGRRIGALPTVGIVIATGVAGAWLARGQGRGAWRALVADLSRGTSPAPAILAGVAVLAGATLLLTPGLLTDLVGFSLLLPPTRRVVLRSVQRRIQRRLERQADRIEVRFWTREDPGGGRGGGGGEGRDRGTG